MCCVITIIVVVVCVVSSCRVYVCVVSMHYLYCWCVFVITIKIGRAVCVGVLSCCYGIDVGAVSLYCLVGVMCVLFQCSAHCVCVCVFLFLLVLLFLLCVWFSCLCCWFMCCVVVCWFVLSVLCVLFQCVICVLVCVFLFIRLLIVLCV